jgi:hypothetical protein
LIKKLLHKKKSKRLAFKQDSVEVLSHPFFSTVDLDILLQREYSNLPYLPKFQAKDSADISNFNAKTEEKDILESVVAPNKVYAVRMNNEKFRDFNTPKDQQEQGRESFYRKDDKIIKY